MEKKVLKQTENIGVIVGLLKSKKIEVKEKDGNRYAYGDIVVESTNGNSVSEIRIGVMQTEIFKVSGKENKSFKRMLTVRDEYKTIEDDGRESADTVKVYVKINENNYYSKDRDEIVESIRIMSTTDFDKKYFLPIEKVNADDKHMAKISFGGRINNMERADDGSLKIEMVGIDYGGKPIKQKMVVPADKARQFESLYYTGCTTTLFYNIVNSVEVKLASEEVAFGESSGLEITNVVRRNEVVGGLKPDLEGITEEDMRTILAQRKAELDALLEEKRNEKTTAAPIGVEGFGVGFGDSSDTTATNPFYV